MRTTLLVAAVAVAGMFSATQSFGQNLAISDYQLVSETRVSRTHFDYVYRASVTNTGPALTNVSATLSSAVPSVTVVDGTLAFGAVAAGGIKPSSDSFTIRVNRTVPFSFSNLSWTFSSSSVPRAPVADAGSPQTAKVGQTVTLSGANSSDPGGAPLTFSWVFLSRPAGSTATLTNANTVSPSFVPDVQGNYTAQLTVNNGSLSATATVVVSTINSRPVANAGADQTAPVTTIVTLNGSGSSDADGNPLTYQWNFVSRPTGSTAVLNNATAVNPTFTIDRAGSYTVQLIVNDGIESSLADTVVISTSNTPPVANAGADRVVTAGTTVVLNGSGSSDVDGDPLTYQWSLVSAPSGSSATLSSSSAVSPTFVADRPGSYVAQLIVNDGKANSPADTVTITTNAPTPVANAGTGQTVRVGQTVTLTGAGSSDPAGLPLTFQWSLTTRPAGSTAVLGNPTSVTPTFTADRPGTYVAQLIVNNGFQNSTPATVTISTENTPPVANAGPDQQVSVGGIVQLTGAASTDVDGDPLTYSWSLTTRPAGSAAVLSNPSAVNPTFTADRPGTYVAQLIVNDGKVNSPPDTVTIQTGEVLPPTANAGPDQFVALGTTVTLNGTQSTDPQGLPLTYQWSLITRPTGSTATLAGATTGTPVFTADRAGSYVAQLIVNNGFQSSVADTVTITTTNTTPTADAGADQNVAVGATVVLNGSGSTDPDQNPLTYQWSLLSKPAGSSAVLSNATGVSPSFTADAAGTYVAQLIVNDGTTNSAPDTVTITAAVANSISVTPETTSVQTYESGTLTITLSAPAGPGGRVVTLASSSASVVVPANATVPAGAASVNVTFNASATAGSSVITASAPGFAADTATVTVTNRDLTLQLASPLVGTGRTVGGTVTLDDPAPTGGVTVTLAVTPSGMATINPPTVTIAGGSTTASFTLTGGNIGNGTVTASAPGYTAASAALGVTGSTINLPSNVEAGPGQSVVFPISLASAAPTGGVTVTLTSSNPAVATITNSVFIPAGSTTPTVQPTLTGVSFGTVSISASAPNYAPDVRQARVTLILTLSPASATVLVDNTRTLTLDLSAPAPTGGLTVNLSSDDPARATVPATVNIPSGSSSANVVVTGKAVGSTTIRANASNVTGAAAAITVEPAPAITLSNVTLGKDLQGSINVSLGSPAPAGNLQVTITSSDVSRLRLATSSTAAGSASITITVPAGQSTSPAFFLNALAGTASVTYTASAPGYANGVGTATFGPSGFLANVCVPTQGCVGAGPVSTSSGSANVSVNVVSVLLNSDLTYAGNQPVRGGLTVNVPVTSSNPSVAAVTVSPVAITAGQTSGTTELDPLAPGTTNLTIGVPSGFSTPTGNSSLGRQIGVTVTAPGISFGGSIAVGNNLENAVQFTLAGPAPAGGLTVTITSADPSRVRLSVDPTTAGTASIAVAVPEGTQTGQFYVHGLASSGTVALNSSAPGFGSGSANVTLTRSGFSGYVCSPSQGCTGAAPFTTTALSPNSQVYVYSFALDEAGNILTNMPVRGGFSVSVPVTSSNTTVGTITTSPVVVNGGESYGLTEFDPAASGTTNIVVGVPAGYTAPNEGSGYSRQISATVTAPGFIVNDVTLGKDLETAVSVSLAAPAGAGGKTVTISSSDPSRVLLSPDATTAGSSSISVVVPEGQQSFQFYAQGLTATGTSQLTFAASGFANAQSVVTLAPSGFVAYVCSAGCTGGADFTTTSFSPNSQIYVYAFQLDSQGTPIASQAVRAGLSVNVPVTSSNTTVGTITTSPVTFSGGDTYVLTEFDPRANGTTTLTVGVPAGFATPVSNGTYDRVIVATVTAPSLLVSDLTIGKDLQTVASVSLTAPAPAGGLQLTLVSSNPSRVLLSADPAVAGTASLTVQLVEGQQSTVLYAQGLTASGTAQLTASAPGFSNGSSTVTLTPSGFVILTPLDAFTTTAASENTPIYVYAAQLDPTTLNYVSNQQVRGGLTVNVPVTSSNPSVGTITTSPLAMQGGNFSGFTEFNPATAGTAVISAGVPSGFSAPSNYRQTTATVQ